MPTPLKVLLLAPHPFYQERGTPIAVDLLLQSFAARGTLVDVLTYHEGADRDYGTGISIHRIPPPPGTHHIRPGFSWKKVVCDLAFHRDAARILNRSRYDVIHAVEESVFMARRLGARHGTPYVYDMDSCMSRQIMDKHPLAKPLAPMMQAMETSAIRDAMAVVPVCDTLADIARASGAKKIFTLRDISLLDPAIPVHPIGLAARTGGTGPRFLYVGNLESYQGIDLLLDACTRAVSSIPEARVIIVGGNTPDIQRYQSLAERSGLSSFVTFIGPRPVADMASLFAEADILLSPRSQGGNTPMKIYSYLASGKPVLATRLETHTQVLDDTVACLVEPTAQAMADGMIRLAQDSNYRKTLGNQARRLADNRYSRTAYAAGFTALYDWVEQQLALRTIRR